MKLPRISQKHIPLVSTVVVYVILYAVGSLAYDGFFSLRVFINFFTDNSFLGIVAVGMTFVILSGSIDLSVGSMLALSCILMAVLMNGPRMFHESDIRDLPGFVEELRAADSPLSSYLRDHLSEGTRRLIASPATATAESAGLRRALARDIDSVVQMQSVYAADRFDRVTIGAETKQVVQELWDKHFSAIRLPKKMAYPAKLDHPMLLLECTDIAFHNGPDRSRLNLALLRDAFPGLLRDSGMRHPVVPIPLAILIVLALGTALGCGMGWVIRAFELPPFIVTLAGMFFARGLALIIRDQALSIKNPFYSWITDWGIDVGEARIPVTAMVFVAVVLVGIYASVWTRFGRNVYALGGNEEAALLMGLPVGRTKVLVHALSGFCAALAGVVFTL
ncbi:hypothetical protein HQ576_05920, partial [bacterium]|nr:hypothetical protein [bacterium]